MHIIHSYYQSINVFINMLSHEIKIRYKPGDFPNTILFLGIGVKSAMNPMLDKACNCYFTSTFLYVCISRLVPLTRGSDLASDIEHVKITWY